MKELWSRLWEDESGQGLVEYVLIIALVAIALIVTIGVFKDAIGTAFTNIGAWLTDTPAPPAG